MTKQEFDAWKNETALSRTQWVVDAIQLENRGTILAFKGGVTGHYILIDGGKAEVGTYEDAIPSITDAMMRRAYSGPCTDQQAMLESFKRAGIDLEPAMVRARNQIADFQRAYQEKVLSRLAPV